MSTGRAGQDANPLFERANVNGPPLNAADAGDVLEVASRTGLREIRQLLEDDVLHGRDGDSQVLHVHLSDVLERPCLQPVVAGDIAVRDEPGVDVRDVEVAVSVACTLDNECVLGWRLVLRRRPESKEALRVGRIDGENQICVTREPRLPVSDRRHSASDEILNARAIERTDEELEKARLAHRT